MKRIWLILAIALMPLAIAATVDLITYKPRPICGVLTNRGFEIIQPGDPGQVLAATEEPGCWKWVTPR